MNTEQIMEIAVKAGCRKDYCLNENCVSPNTISDIVIHCKYDEFDKLNKNELFHYAHLRECNIEHLKETITNIYKEKNTIIGNLSNELNFYKKHTALYIRIYLFIKKLYVKTIVKRKMKKETFGY